MEKVFVSNSAEETMQLGQKVAKAANNGSTFCFSGDLGAGKTTFVRGMAQALNIKSVVQSPTFNIMKIYFDGIKPLIHIDAYRLADVNNDIGLDEYIGYETGLTVIEWPDFIKDLIPDNAINVNITNQGDNQRRIVISTDDSSLLEAFN